jgi:hypothetical protein
LWFPATRARVSLGLFLDRAAVLQVRRYARCAESVATGGGGECGFEPWRFTVRGTVELGYGRREAAATSKLPLGHHGRKNCELLGRYANEICQGQIFLPVVHRQKDTN